MSLLNQATDTVTVFPETVYTDSDGNTMTKAADVGTTHRARIQPIEALRGSTENLDGGSHTQSRYRLVLINHPTVLSAQSQIEWNGDRYAIEGDARIYNGSRRTRHVDYVMVRG